MLGIYDINNCSDLTYKERLDIYKSVGFSEIGVYLDDSYSFNNEKYIDIISYAKEIGLKIRQVHIDYKISNLICDESTNEYFEYVSKKLQEAEALGIPYVIAHTSKSNDPPKLNNIQLDKFKNMMLNLKDLNVILCLENVRVNNNLEKIFELNLDNVKMCFDLGHAHCYGDEKELFNKFKNIIVCSHLHNNFGTDSHNILDNGEIDYKYFLKHLSNIDNISNCLECFPEQKGLTKDEFIKFIKDCYSIVKNY